MALTEGTKDHLLAALDSYGSGTGREYDELFYEVHNRISEAGDAGKMDIAAITFWKRSGQGKWIGDLLRRPEVEVRAATRAGFTAGDDRAALTALAELPGFKRQEAIATALLCACDPMRFGVMDRRALKALALMGRGVGSSRGMTIRYLETIRGLRDEVAASRPGTTARDIDKALFMLGG